MSINTNNNSSSNNNITQEGERGMNNNNFDKKEFNKQIRRQYDKGWMYIIIGISIIILGFYVGLIVSTPKDIEKTPAKLELPPPNLPPLVEPEKLDPQKILSEAINPAINKCKEKNEEVLKSCLMTLDERLKECYAGIDPFLEDLTSLGTKAGIMWNWAVGDKEAYVRDKFEKYVISEAKLNEIVSAVVEQYIEGVSANLNEMYSRIRVDIIPMTRQFNIPESTVTSFVQESFRNAFVDVQENTHMLIMNAIISYGASELGSTIVVRGGSFVLGAAVTQLSSALATVSQSILVPALAMAGVNLTSTLGGTGGGIAASTATGASIGSVFPGLGTIIGILVGFGVGYLVEEHLDSNFRDEMKPKIVESLDEIKKQITNSFKNQMSQISDQYMGNLKNEMDSNTYRLCNEENSRRDEEYKRQKQLLEEKIRMYYQQVQQNRQQLAAGNRI